MKRRLRRFGAITVLAIVGLMTLALPAIAYNEENVKHVRMHRLDPISCTSPIRVVAVLTDRRGAPVPDAVVNFQFKKSFPGDSFAPSAGSTADDGTVQTVVELGCVVGARIIRATVPGDGAGQLVIPCTPRSGCSPPPLIQALRSPSGLSTTFESSQASSPRRGSFSLR
jgi:hypothetical protein